MTDEDYRDIHGPKIWLIDENGSFWGEKFYAQSRENEDLSFRLEHVMYLSVDTHLRDRIQGGFDLPLLSFPENFLRFFLES